MMRIVLLILAFGLCSWSQAASLVRNPDFDAGIAEWDLAGNCFAPGFDTSVGSPADGALSINCFGGADKLETATQCVPLAAPARVDFSARWTENGTAPGVGTVAVAVAAFAGQDCSGLQLDVYGPETMHDVDGASCCGTPWNEAAFLNRPLADGTQSVRVSLGAGAGADVVFDHVELAPSIVFADGFENAGIAGGVGASRYAAGGSGR